MTKTITMNTDMINMFNAAIAEKSANTEKNKKWKVKLSVESPQGIMREALTELVINEFKYQIAVASGVRKLVNNGYLNMSNNLSFEAVAKVLDVPNECLANYKRMLVTALSIHNNNDAEKFTFGMKMGDKLVVLAAEVYFRQMSDLYFTAKVSLT